MDDAALWSRNFGGAGMQAYEDALVGSLFLPWAERLLDHVDAAPGSTVVDVACGPGTVARRAAGRVGIGGSVIGCDLNAAMLAIARNKPPVVSGAPITYHECPADALAVDDAAAEAVVCQQGLQFFPDRPAAIAEMHRVARPGARIGVSVWCEIGQCAPFAALATAIAELLGDDMADGYRDGPWGLGDAAVLAADFEAGGFHDVRIEHETVPVSFDGGVPQLVASLDAAPVGEAIRTLDDEGRTAFLDAVERAASSLLHDGGVHGDTASHTVIAVR